MSQFYYIASQKEGYDREYGAMIANTYTYIIGRMHKAGDRIRNVVALCDDNMGKGRWRLILGEKRICPGNTVDEVIAGIHRHLPTEKVENQQLLFVIDSNILGRKDTHRKFLNAECITRLCHEHQDLGVWVMFIHPGSLPSLDQSFFLQQRQKFVENLLYQQESGEIVPVQGELPTARYLNFDFRDLRRFSDILRVNKYRDT